jgi:hypothetical protein
LDPIRTRRQNADSGMLYADRKEQAMPADKLGRYMRSDLFLSRVNAAVRDAVRDLEEHGITPTYIQRPQSDESKVQPDSNVAREPGSE